MLAGPVIWKVGSGQVLSVILLRFWKGHFLFSETWCPLLNRKSVWYLPVVTSNCTCSWSMNGRRKEGHDPKHHRSVDDSTELKKKKNPLLISGSSAAFSLKRLSLSRL